MKLKFYFIVLFSLIFSTNSFSLPRCEQLYETIYSDQKNTDVFTNSYIDQKTIGIRLLKELLSVENEDLEALHLLAQTYKTLGNFKETEDIYNNILAVDKYDATAFYNLSSLSKIKI